ncbi:hypothetical protein [Salarchaeum japonicum]|uniref:Uncharacterized protein n=1 Tax=Salarchaeum japonicum TaxID=555573 RepID=A0AAV3SXW9_9EURY|nr:hypothetical protein [Salarchaeum japonicum]
MSLNQSARNARATTTEPRPSDDDAVLFEEVQQALCEDGFASPPEGRHLAQWVRSELRTALGNVDVDVQNGSRECDLLVEDTVGVELVDGLSAYGHAGIHRHLETVGRDCDYLVVFVHELPSDCRDAWWMVKRRCTPHGLGVTDIAFVKPDDGETATTKRSPLTAWFLLGPAMVFVAAYLAVGLLEAAHIANHPMLMLIVPTIGAVCFLALVLKCFGHT